MKREPLVYAVLVVAALAVAFRTWTHQDRVATSPGTVEPWHESPDALLGLEYTGPGKRVEIHRAGPADSSYLWATVDTSAFVVGEDVGQRLVSALATPHALRDLGVPANAQRHAFGLDTAHTRLVIRFRNGSHDLLIGGKAYLTGESYVLDRSSGHAYVLSADALAPLENAANMLPERRLHAFPPERVATVVVRGGGRTLNMQRLGPAPTDQTPSATPAAWAPSAGPQRPDAAFATFMQRLNDLWSAAYTPRVEVRTLTPVLRVDYADARGHALGFLEIFRGPGSGPSAEYFARSELTRVLVRLYPGAGDNLAADIAQGL